MKRLVKEEIIARRGYAANTVGSAHDIYIASPLPAARYVAQKIGNQNKTVVEFCCGVGLTLVELAKRCQLVIGVDISDTCLQAAAHNLQQASIAPEKYRLIKRDLNDTEAYENLKADIAIYDIPNWYKDLSMNPNFDYVVENIFNRVAGKLVVFAPPQYEIDVQKHGFKREQIWISGKYDRDLLYLGFNDAVNGRVYLS